MKGVRSKKYTVNSKADITARRNRRIVKNAYAKERNAASYMSDDQNIGSWKIQLDKLGLEIREILADGNCLFRALADQLDGNSDNHLRYRSQVCNYMANHQSDFAPFLAEGITFDKYTLRKPGTFAGNDALVAFANLHNVAVVIHQLDTPAFRIEASDNSTPPTRELHLSYHNGEHYSSIRLRGDKSSTPTLIKLKVTKTKSDDDTASINTDNPSTNDQVDKAVPSEQASGSSESSDFPSDVSVTSLTLSTHDDSTSTLDSGVGSESGSVKSEKSTTKSKKSSTKSERKKEKKKRALLRHQNKLQTSKDTNNNQAEEDVYEISGHMKLLAV